MKTKWQYYKENRYYVSGTIALIIFSFSVAHFIQNGFSWGWLFVTMIPVAIFIVSWFALNAAYRKWAEHEISKQNWTQTRTDMINTEEDD